MSLPLSRQSEPVVNIASGEKSFSPARISRHAIFVGASWAFVACFVSAFLLLNYGPASLRYSNDFRFIAFNGFNILPAFATAMTGAVYARRFSPQSTGYYGWVFLALAGLSFTVGSLIWGFYELFADFKTPFPSWADVGYLGAGFFLIAGVFVLFSALPIAGRLRLLLDSAIAMTSVAAFLWYVLIARLWEQSDATLFARLIGMAYPMADIVALYGACVIFFGERERVGQRRSVAYLVGGIVCIALADSGFSYYSLSGSYSTGMWVDFGWAIGWTLMANAIRLQIARSGESVNPNIEYSMLAETPATRVQRAASLGRLLVPYISGAFAIALIALYDLRHNGTIEFSVLGWGTSLLVLVALRQVFTVLENQHLMQRLASLLEYTKELNDVLDVEHALIVTVNYARQLAHAEGAVAWLHGKDETPEFHTERRLSSPAGAAQAKGQSTKMSAQSGSVESLEKLRALAAMQTATQATLKATNNSNSSHSPTSNSPISNSPTSSTRSADENVASLPLNSFCLPLLQRNEIIGTLAVARENSPFSATERRILESMTLEASTAISNALSYRTAVEAADCDSVTGLLNHRAAHERLRIEWERASQKGLPLSVVMIDLNDFKFFNDTYGHPVGDQVLQVVARILRQTCRTADVLARYGGDEFVLILPDTDIEGARIVAQRVKARTDQEGFYLAGSDTVLPIGLSLGIATFPDDARTRTELLAVADANLYSAKLHKEAICITREVQRSNKELRADTSFGFLDCLVTAVDNKDAYTRRHSEDVTDYALWIAEEIGLSQDSMRAIRIGGLLHDVGKIGVPDEILRKPGKLTDEEFEIIQQHPVIGALIVSGVPGMQFIVETVRSHHERWDGRGYPDGLAGENIPLLGRILAVADAFSAMTTTRPYRRGMAWNAALAEVEKHRGAQFDPEIADVFLRVARQRLAEKHASDESTPPNPDNQQRRAQA